MFLSNNRRGKWFLNQLLGINLETNPGLNIRKNVIMHLKVVILFILKLKVSSIKMTLETFCVCGLSREISCIGHGNEIEIVF